MMVTRFVSSSHPCTCLQHPSQQHSARSDSCHVECFTENPENYRACMDLKGSCTQEVANWGPTGQIQPTRTARSYHYWLPPIIHPPSGGPPRGKQGLGGWMSCHTNPHSLPLGFLTIWPDMHPAAHLSKKGPPIILYPPQIFIYRQWLTGVPPEWPCSAAPFLHLIHSLLVKGNTNFSGFSCQLFHRPCTAAFCNSCGLRASWSLAMKCM